MFQWSQFFSAIAVVALGMAAGTYFKMYSSSIELDSRVRNLERFRTDQESRTAVIDERLRKMEGDIVRIATNVDELLRRSNGGSHFHDRSGT